jgi:SpoIIAA-like
MDRVRFITHQSKRILLVDLTSCSPEEVIERLPQVQRMVTAQPRNSVLTLSDLTDAEFSRAAFTRMKEVAVFDKPYVKRAALVGAESLPKVFYEALKTFSQREFRRFKTREEAMDWLVKEEG